MSTTIQSTIRDLQSQLATHEAAAKQFRNAIAALQPLVPDSPPPPALTAKPRRTFVRQAPIIHKRGPYTPILRAETLFQPGQPVRLKDEALDKVCFGVGGHQRPEQAIYGTVAGFSRTKPSHVYVRVVGKKAGRLFKARFWEVVQNAEVHAPMIATSGVAS